MSELDLLNLARSCGQSLTSDFAQVITITFAMIVAIYYFLHQAGIRMKLFAFAVYTCGMLTFLGLMILESGLGLGAQKALVTIPPEIRAIPTQVYIGMRSSWVGTTANILINVVYWILWLGTGYLLFSGASPDSWLQSSGQVRHNSISTGR